MSKSVLYTILIVSGLWSVSLVSRYVSHATMSSQEEIVGGIRFKHIKKSVNGKRDELFYVNESPVPKEEYEKQLDEAHLIDVRKQRHRTERQSQSYIDFTDKAQTAILEKLVKNMLQEVRERIDRLNNDTLKPYLLFHDAGIKSSYQLAEMKHYVQQQLADLQELIDDHDTRALQEICDKVEAWPEYLETCFKDSVQNAIKQSDDTSTLKELLAFVSE